MKCIILAGGFGERLWPVSRELYPKTLLNLRDEKTLIQHTFELACSITSEKNILTVTNIRQLNDTFFQLKKICKNPVIISEPVSRNTAPAISSALTFLKQDRDETVIILPVDFYVENKDKFAASVNNAKKLVKSGYISVLGVKPVYAEEGFGYIQTGDVLKYGKKVKSFIEKPKYDEVQQYIKNDDYYWNCGIYVSKISVLLDTIKKYAPDVCVNFSKDMFDENNKIKYEFYENLPEISIDYAIMEKTDNLAFVELDDKWNDYGSWKAVYNNCPKDAKGNVVFGNVLLDKVKDAFVYSSKELVAVSGMKDIIVIETEDAILVCDKEKTQNISKIVKKLKNDKNPAVLTRKTVFRPWGFYTCLNNGTGWLTKIITVSPGHKLSLQSHNYRSEHWVVLSGEAVVILDGKKYMLSKGKSIDIPLKAKHSLQNKTKEPLKILEVQKGEYISEDDIIRYEDMYGRI